jgi:chorismate dehydratase
LASVIWGVEFRRRLKIVPLDASRHVPPDAQAVLLVEDAVVSHPPLGYHYQLDLGAMWFEISGLPFVFSVWAAEDGAHLQEIHDLLAASRAKGVKHLRSIARQQAPRIGWPEDLARRYLLDQLRYEFTDAHRDGMEEFFYLCQAVGVIEHVKPVKYLYEPK